MQFEDKMIVSILWTVACVVTATVFTQCQPAAGDDPAVLRVVGNVTSGCKGDVQDLHIMGLYPFSGEWGGGESQLASTKIAINQINTMCAVHGYRLILHPADTQCDEGVAVREFLHMLSSPQTMLAILGPACSFVTEIIARASHFWNLVDLSYASTSPALSDKSKFPTFARVSMPEEEANPAKISLLREFNWVNICIFLEYYEHFGSTVGDLINRLVEEEFTVLAFQVFSGDPAIDVRNLKDYDCRIIVGVFYQEAARRVFCEAYKLGLYGRRVVWLLAGWYDKGWWRVKDDINCSLQQMDEAVRGHFQIGVDYFNPKQERTVSGWLPSDFKVAYQKEVQNRTLFGRAMTSHGYDAAWALALALNATQNTLRAEGKGKSLEDFTYRDKELSDLLYRSLLNVSFMGLKGLISFNAEGDPMGLINIKRYQAGRPPRDATGKKIRFERVSKVVYTVVCLLAALGIALALVFLAFNIILRHDRVVKMSSPRLNNVILLGCIFCYSSVFVKDVGAEHGVLGCEMKTSLLVVGVSLALGALFAKTWRVHTIFASRKVRKKVVSDGQLMAMVAVLVVINVIVLVTWWVNDRRTVKTVYRFTTKEDDIFGDIDVKYYERLCSSEQQIYYKGTLYGTLALVLLIGIMLAFETRNVHYKELNDSKLIGMCIYIVALLSIFIVIKSVALKRLVNAMYIINSSVVFVGTTAILCLIFIPKMKSFAETKTAVQTLHSSPITKLQEESEYMSLGRTTLAQDNTES